MTSIERIVLQELRGRSGTTREIAQRSTVSELEVLAQLRDLNDRIKILLGLEYDAITATASGVWKADGIAGLLRLNPQVELEVVPKFLDPSNDTWRSDFFLLAVLVRTGHLLIHDDISAGMRDRGDLATLIARSLLNLHEKNQRRPIRGYKRVQRNDFAMDGDVEWETLVMPDPDGFLLSRLELTRQNPQNATLAAAVEILIREVADIDTQSQLRQFARFLGPQSAPPRAFPPLPQRHDGWKGAYDLAQLVVEGLGLDLNGGTFAAPGFVMSTWSAWQSLCEEVVRRALPDHRVVGQHRWILGYRGSDPVYATPDISPFVGTTVDFLLDAKYKTRVGRKPSINSSDVYESLAFLNAADATNMSLLYPSTRSLNEHSLGSWTEFDSVLVENLTIRGIEIQIQGISRREGFNEVVAGARAALGPKADCLNETV